MILKYHSRVEPYRRLQRGYQAESSHQRQQDFLHGDFSIVDHQRLRDRVAGDEGLDERAGTQKFCRARMKKSNIGGRQVGVPRKSPQWSKFSDEGKKRKLVKTFCKHLVAPTKVNPSIFIRFLNSSFDFSVLSIKVHTVKSFKFFST